MWQAILPALLAATPRLGTDCADDPASLASQAENLVAAGTPIPEDLAEAGFSSARASRFSLAGSRIARRGPGRRRGRHGRRGPPSRDRGEGGPGAPLAGRTPRARAAGRSARGPARRDPPVRARPRRTAEAWAVGRGLNRREHPAARRRAARAAGRPGGRRGGPRARRRHRPVACGRMGAAGRASGPADRPGRDAEIAWEHADQAGSREALFALARIASGGGRSSRAAALYRRYLAEAAGGVHAEEAQAGLEREERRQGTLRGAAFGIRRVRSSCRRPLVGEAAHGPHARGVAEARSRRDA